MDCREILALNSWVISSFPFPLNPDRDLSYRLLHVLLREQCATCTFPSASLSARSFRAFSDLTGQESEQLLSINIACPKDI
jgi:hypothetical protein